MKLRDLPLLKRLIPSARKLVSTVTWPGGYKIVRRYDVLLLLNFRNYIDRELLFYGRHERRQIAVLTAAMARHGCNLFIDVGANIGLYSVIVGARGLSRAVIAFEPDARSVGPFQANLLINGLIDHVKIHPVALSDRDGTVPFRPDPGTSTCLSCVGRDGPLSVPCARLDSILSPVGQRLFVKIDIEGHELAALGGMRRILERNRCFLQIECFPENASALQAFMAEAGYHRRGQIDNDQYYDNFAPAHGGGSG